MTEKYKNNNFIYERIKFDWTKIFFYYIGRGKTKLSNGRASKIIYLPAKYVGQYAVVMVKVN